MNQLFFLSLNLLLIFSQDSITVSQTADSNTSSSNSTAQASNWLDSALSDVLNNFRNDKDSSSGLMVNGSAHPRNTSKAMYAVIRPDGTSTTTIYSTDEKGVTTTDVQENK